MNCLTRLNGLLLAVSGMMAQCGLLHAQELSQDDLTPLAQSLAPLFDETTIAFGHVDLKRIEIPVLEKKLAKWSFGKLLPNEALPEVAKTLDSIRESILKSGGRHVILTVPLVDSIPMPVIALPLNELPLNRSGDLSLLKKELGPLESLGFQSKYLADVKVMVYATPSAIRRIESRVFSTRSDIMQLLSVTKKGLASINFVPSKDHLKVIREFEPQFPKPFQNVNGELLAEGLQSISLTLESLEPIQLNLQIQSEHTEAAQDILEAITGLRRQIPLQGPEQIFLNKLLTDVKLSKDQPGLELKIGEDEERFWLALKPFFAKAREQVKNQQQVNQLKQILLGLHNFHDAYRSFPDLGRPQDNGKPGLSWRVHILPFLGEVELYNQFKLNEPWDSKHNLKLVGRIPKIYQWGDLPAKSGKTVFVMPRGKSFFANPYADESDEQKRKNGRSFRDILDGTSNTIAVLTMSTEQAVIWTQPVDWRPSNENILKLIKGTTGDHLTFASADGAIHRVPLKGLSAKKMMAWLTIAGGEAVGFDR